MHYVGVDVSCDSLQLAHSDKASSFSNSPEGISALLDSLDEGVCVVLEPTSAYHHVLIDKMVDRDINYTLVNPRNSAAYARLINTRTKTDKADAYMLSGLGRTHALAPTNPPDETQQQLKAMRRHLEWLQKEARATRNRLETACRSPWTPQSVARSLKRTIKRLDDELGQAKDALDERLKANKELQSQLELLITIPGVGKNTAVMVLAEMPQVQNCESSKAWVAFCGLNPEIRQSGKSSFSRLSRVGSSRIRAKLYMAAVVALRVNPLVKDMRQRLNARGKSGKLVVVAAMNKLIRLCYGVLKSGKPFDLSIHQQALTP